MGDYMTHHLSNFENDVLKEIGNIGVGNAATSMSNLMNKNITMNIPYVHLLTINEIMDIVGGPEEIIVTTFCKMKGDISGTVYFVLSMEEASLIAKQMLQDETVEITIVEDMNDMVTSALREVANIVIGSYISALADFTNMQIQTTIPFLSVDMAAATLVTGLLEFSRESDHAILIGSKFFGEEMVEQAKSHFLLVPDLDSIPELFKALGVSDYD